MATNKASSTTGSPIKLLKHYSKLHKAFMMAKRDSLKDRALQLCSCMINSTASFPGIQILFISETTLPTVQVSKEQFNGLKDVQPVRFSVKP